MPAAPTSYPYLSWKHKKIVLRLPIPKAVQPIGQKMFRAVMPQTAMPEAHAASLPILAEWRQQVTEAHTANRDHRQAEVMRLRKAFEAFDGKPLGAVGGELFGRITDFLFRTYGGVTAAQQRLALADAKGNVALALPVPARQPLAAHQRHGAAVHAVPEPFGRLEGEDASARQVSRPSRHLR